LVTWENDAALGLTLFRTVTGGTGEVSRCVADSKTVEFRVLFVANLAAIRYRELMKELGE